ncbi:HK97-gp10 family putative phage morphogenesis protein [Lutibacter holmesii]|uniref:HK97-gp10 family putative phage morphogenesis protein n=1 Tax=Lutibacter holmesii TaxID=1137985 RepID=A0ABW3WKN2_9FLAO
MPKSLVEIKGFAELQQKIKQLPDKVTKREMLKILGQVATPTVNAAKASVKDSKRPHIQKRKGQAFGTYITPGNLKKSIGKIRGKRGLGKQNAVIYVGARAGKRQKNDGWYGKFVGSGTIKQTANPFTEIAYNQTKGMVTADAETKVEKYIQKQINKLSS